MGISKEKILEKRKRLVIQREKDEAKLKVLQAKLKKATLKIAEVEKKEEMERKMILGNYILEKIKSDSSFKTWLEGEIASSALGAYEKSLFGFSEMDAK
jgi:hypothetical protein